MINAGRYALVRLAIAILVVLSGAGCTLLSPVQNQTRKAVLNQIPLTISQRERQVATLLVLTPEASPIYDTTRMAYRNRPFEVDYFSRHEWGATPSQMLLPLLIRTLEDTHAFSAVVAPPYSSHYTYMLRTEIIELTQDFTSDPAAVRLSLRVQLSDSARGRIINIKEIDWREPMQQKTPYAGVVAANIATANALREVAGFVLENIE